MIIGGITVALFLLIDLTLGRQLLSIVNGELPKDKFRTQHPVYHHTLAPNYQGIGYWGPGTYHVCTNGSGFKDSCDKIGKIEKSFDVAFIGDSFTEGVGLPYEQTFVGMVAAQYPDLKIANLGVVSYAPRIYLTKLKALYAQGYQFKRVIVFIDIGDVMDEALTYDLVDGQVISKHETLPEGSLARARRMASRWLPLTGEAWNRVKASATAMAHLIRGEASAPGFAAPVPTASTPASNATVPETSQRDSAATPQPGQRAKDVIADHGTEPARVSPLSPAATATAVPQTLRSVIFAPNVEPSIYERNYGRSEWTYNPQSTAYGPRGVMGTVKDMRATMDELYNLVRENNGQLSVGVYPWPGQIKYDKEDSLQVRIWEEFCATRCEHFYNAFPAFFKLTRQLGEDDVIYKYYMLGDMHFGEAGNSVVAQTIIEAGLR